MAYITVALEHEPPGCAPCKIQRQTGSWSDACWMIGTPAGVDWEKVCEGEELAIVQDLNLACEDCVFIPKNRQNQVRENDFDEFHYQCAPGCHDTVKISAPQSQLHLCVCHSINMTSWTPKSVRWRCCDLSAHDA